MTEFIVKLNCPYCEEDNRLEFPLEMGVVHLPRELELKLFICDRCDKPFVVSGEIEASLNVWELKER